MKKDCGVKESIVRIYKCALESKMPMKCEHSTHVIGVPSCQVYDAHLYKVYARYQSVGGSFSEPDEKPKWYKVTSLAYHVEV